MTRPELSLITKLFKQDTYVKYRHFIIIKEERELKNLYSALDELMDKYQRDITFEEYALYVTSSNEDDTIRLLLKQIEGSTLQDDLAEDLLLQYKEKALAHDVAITAIEVTEGKKSFESLYSLIDSHGGIQEDITSEFSFVTDDLEELYSRHVQKHGLRWRLNSLNKMLGSLRKGSFGFLFARPETGKTTFLASEMTYFASQLSEDEGDILWINNEEDGDQVKLRIFQATLGVQLLDLYKDRAAANESFRKLNGHRIKLIDQASISKHQTEKLCKTLKPSAIIFDQLDKIRGFQGDREDLRLGTIYQWARELAKTYCPVIAVSQADGSGEGKKWLTMENVANAKTAKQAEADWILGIGATHQEGFEYIRHLHASKNKLTGDEDTDPNLRHGKVDVLIVPQIARYKDYE